MEGQHSMIGSYISMLNNEVRRKEVAAGVRFDLFLDSVSNF